MKRIILGTAGHIDHGKTSFIKALTGIDCDRLKEEKERGITIELGYAHLTLPSGIKVGIVDVPGHEKFVSKMVAGASGIDVVALIISADEGIKPQTKEHLYICELLKIKQGIVVITKIDLVDNELLELQKEDIRDFLKGTFLENAPIVEVSSITGEGVDKFRQILDELAKNLSERPVDTPFRLPIDDVITIKGFGTVIRGTAVSGRIKTVDEVVFLPENLKGRIRGIQSHGTFVDEGFAGERLAINVPDFKKEDLRRGMLVVKEGYFHLTKYLLVDFFYLPYNTKPLKSRIVAQFHVMTMKTTAQLFFLNVDKVLPGQKVYALVKLDKPYAFSYKDPYVIRGFGIYTTMGGGVVLHPFLKEINRNMITDEYIKTFVSEDIEKICSILVKEQGADGLSANYIMGLLNIGPDTAQRILSDLLKRNILVEDKKNKKFFHKDVYENLVKNVLDTISKYHIENPLKSGIKKEELLDKVGNYETLFNLIVRDLAEKKNIVVDGDIIKLSDFVPGGEDKAFKPLEDLLKNSGLQTEEPQRISEILKREEKEVKDMLATLVKNGRVIKIKDNYYIHREAFENFKGKIMEFFKLKDILTPQDVRDMFNISRKYMIPLLEYLDSIKITIRVPEGRRLRRH
ncbi:MAG: selenocysteine-specific translation elongation factor [Proteobacteria bacterium]|nr:selenocysteine-specific translation elongation factor [Pseudomonadota bacterium]